MKCIMSIEYVSSDLKHEFPGCAHGIIGGNTKAMAQFATTLMT
jgi:hypothetical protein